jgi:hypothetical protein
MQKMGFGGSRRRIREAASGGASEYLSAIYTDSLVAFRFWK